MIPVLLQWRKRGFDCFWACLATAMVVMVMMVGWNVLCGRNKKLFGKVLRSAPWSGRYSPTYHCAHILLYSVTMIVVSGGDAKHIIKN